MTDGPDSAQVVLVFLSAGYFDSRNCLRELKAASSDHKRLVIVHEADVAHGGRPLKLLKDECPVEQRTYVFQPRWPPIPWQRTPPCSLPTSTRHPLEAACLF